MKGRKKVLMLMSLLSAVFIPAAFPLTSAAAFAGQGGTAIREASTGQERERASAYLIAGDFMESGAYEQYLDTFINADTPPAQDKVQDRTQNQPNIYLDFMGTDTTKNFTEGYPARMNLAFCCSLFYMEVPGNWSVGATNSCQFVFYHKGEQMLGVTNQGKVQVDPSEDRGRVLVFEEWPDQDFSTPESIQAYVNSGGANHLLEPVLGKGGGFTCTEYATEYHDFIRCEGQYDNRLVTMYIPITPSENENFVILFETFNGTKEKENAYAMQEPIIKTLILQPYFYDVKEGDSLMSIAKQLTDDSGNYLKIAQYKPNRKGDKALDPNQIYPGQRIGIPLNLLFEKKHYR